TTGTALLPSQSAVAEDRFGDSPVAPLKGDVAPLDKLLRGQKGKVLAAQVKGRKYVIKILDENGHIRFIEAPGGAGGASGIGGGGLGGGGGPGGRGGGGVWGGGGSWEGGGGRGWG